MVSVILIVLLDRILHVGVQQRASKIFGLFYKHFSILSVFSFDRNKMWTHCPGKQSSIRILITQMIQAILLELISRSSIDYAVVLFDLTPDFSLVAVAFFELD